MKRRDVVVAAVSSLIACLVVGGTRLSGCGHSPANLSRPSPESTCCQDSTGGCPAVLGQQWSVAAPEVVAKVMPSVVQLSATTYHAESGGFAGENGQGDSQSPTPRQFVPRMMEGGESVDLGSGVIISKAGRILTNQHVVRGADEISVRLHDGRVRRAKLVGADHESDLALLELTEQTDGLEPVEFGDSEKLRLGEAVIAIGHPFGLNSSVTLGIISATGRSDVGLVDYEDFIQTDAAINPGNSGGPLVDLSGELVGINTAIFSATGGYQGVSFAIPSNMARSIADDLTEQGRVERAWLGVKVQQLDRALAEGLGLETDTPGVIVTQVHPDSPARRAGLRRGDVKIGRAHV